MTSVQLYLVVGCVREVYDDNGIMTYRLVEASNETGARYKFTAEFASEGKVVTQVEASSIIR